MNKAAHVFEKIALSNKLLLRAAKKAPEYAKKYEKLFKINSTLASTKLPIPHGVRMKLYDNFEKYIAKASKKATQEVGFLQRVHSNKADEVLNAVKQSIAKLLPRN